MAKIVPYGDLNAHGSLANSLTFRRRYNYVILQKKPFPKQPNSAGQLAQRLAFSTAVNEWYFLTNETKLFYNTRGSQLNMTGQNLYVKQRLLNNLPSTTPIAIKKITNAILINYRATDPNGVNWMFRSIPQDVDFADVYDNNGAFSEKTGSAVDNGLKILIQPENDPTADYEFRDGVAISWTKADTSTGTQLLRVPEIVGEVTGLWLWVSADGSTYWDSAYTQLACTPIF